MRETTWELRGLRFSCLEWGDPDDPQPPTVLLHGYLDHAGAWEEVAPALPGWRIALDQRGHGRSAWAAAGHGYFFQEYVADLDALVERLGRPVRLVGHSMGGTVSTLYAGARPDRVLALASVDGLGLYDQEAEAADRLVGFLDGVRRPPRSRVYPSLEAAAARLESTYAISPARALALARRAVVEAPGGVCWSYDPRHRVRGAVPYRQSHHLPLLARIRCPVLAVHPGAPTFAPADLAHLEAAISDLRRVTIPDTTHMLHLQEPALLAAAVSAFFGGEPGPAP